MDVIRLQLTRLRTTPDHRTVVLATSTGARQEHRLVRSGEGADGIPRGAPVQGIANHTQARARDDGDHQRAEPGLSPQPVPETDQDRLHHGLTLAVPCAGERVFPLIAPTTASY